MSEIFTTPIINTAPIITTAPIIKAPTGDPDVDSV
jgi:hypothetical protein